MINGERFRMVDDPDLQPERFHPISATQLVADYPVLRPPVIDGLLRRGETANIISASKVGKSWLTLSLAWSVATGRNWLGFDTSPGKVLVFDNELHPETLAYRLDKVADAMMIDHRDRDQVDVLPLRGKGIPITALAMHADIEPNVYTLVVFDALYRAIPAGVSENDNAQMMGLYNSLDHYACEWNVAIAVVHHSSKGSQGDKSVTDTGAGAGAISRAADCHVIIRAHELDDHSVMESVSRSFAPAEPQTIRFDYPLWCPVAVAPELKRPGRKDKQRQDDEDTKALAVLLAKIPDPPKAIQQAILLEQTEFGVNRFKRLLGKLVSDGLVAIRRKRRKGGKREMVFYSKSESTSGNASGCDSGNF